MEKTNITTEELKTLLVANNFDAAATAEAISKVMPLDVADIEKAIGDNLAWFTCDLDEGEPIELDENELNVIAEDINALFTYDVFFSNDDNVINKGFHQTYEECKGYIDSYNGTDESYFEDFKGGYVYIKCNETGEFVYEEPIPAEGEVDEDNEMHLKDFSEIYKMLEDEIEDDGVELEEGVKPSVAELLDYYLANSDLFYSIIFKDYDYERNVNHLCELTEDEREQVEKLRRFCKE